MPATDLGGVEVLKRGNLYLVADASGDIRPDPRGLGLYDLDTRVLSCSILRVDGRLVDEDALSPISIARRRWIAGGLAERVSITNHGDTPRSVGLDLELDADAADIFEVRGLVRPRRGTYLPIEVDGDRVTFGYVGLDGLLRRTTVTAVGAEASAGADAATGTEGSVRLSWTVDVAAGGHVEIGWDVVSELVEHGADRGPSGPRGAGGSRAVRTAAAAAAEDAAWRARGAAIRTDDPQLDRIVDRSFADLLLLRNDGPREGQHYVAAGVPWYTTLFGRDSILTALEVLPFRPDVARETLQVLADWQATELDAVRDMEPGKILHELRFGELARTGEVHYRPYFGTADATPLWLVLLEATYRWTGDVELLRSLWPNALAALEWIDRHGDRDGDGFVEYERAAPTGAPNHGWKDSDDPIRHADGTIASGPIALVEVQGYAYDAKVRCASLASTLGDDALAARLLREAEELRRRFDEAFWAPELGCYAIALDGAKRRVATVASNQGHCLWSGIVPSERVDAVVDRLLDPSMDSGWGIRTFAAGQPGYDPLSYHVGSVWPHDNAIIAAGMRRAGRDDAAAHVASRMLEAAAAMPDGRLPELFSGADRGSARAPLPYPVACSPQAWSAATPLSLLGTLLGLQADAARGRLEISRPILPDGVDEVTVERLRLGTAASDGDGAGDGVDDVTVDLHFRREGDRTAVDVMRREGMIEVQVRG